MKTLQPKKNNAVLLACVCGVIAIITFITFSPCLDNGFTNWDDPVYVKDNPLVTANTIPASQIFITPVSANYHPLTILSLALDYHLSKLEPRQYHLENLILHVFNTILVFVFILLLTRRNLLMASIVALFFGIHPMHVESVSWVSERKDVLYVFFFIAGLITYLQYKKTKNIIWYSFTFLLFLLSCLSKGMAVVFPVILFLIDYLNHQKLNTKLILEKIPFLVVSVAFGIIAFIVQQKEQAITAMSTFTLFQRLMCVSYGATQYIIKLFMPVKLSALYPYPDIYSPDGIPLIFYLSPFILVIILALLIYCFLKKKREIVFGLLFYFVSVALVLQFISVGSAIMADRYSYLSYIGLLFIVAFAINNIIQVKSGTISLIKYPVIIIAITGAIVFSYESYSRTMVWKNSETLWSNVIENYPDAAIAYASRGNYYTGINETDKALTDYNRALKLNVFSSNAYKGALYNRGMIYYNKGKTDSAFADLNKVITIFPDYAQAYANRGLIYYDAGNKSLALYNYNKAISLDPDNATAYGNRGLLYYKYMKDDSALADFNKAITLNPNEPTYYYNRGLEYKAINQYQKAFEDFTKGIQLNPTNVDLYYNELGLCAFSLQNYNEAVAWFSKCIDRAPTNSVYRLNRSIVERRLGQISDANADSLKSLRLQGQ